MLLKDFDFIRNNNININNNNNIIFPRVIIVMITKIQSLTIFIIMKDGQSSLYPLNRLRFMLLCLIKLSVPYFNYRTLKISVGFAAMKIAIINDNSSFVWETCILRNNFVMTSFND